MEVIAYKRYKKGTDTSRRLRRAGKTPGIVYGIGSDPQCIELDQKTISHALKNEGFHSSILDLQIVDDTPQEEANAHAHAQRVQAQVQVLLREVQYHPFKPLVLHIDFQRIDPNKPIHTKVPLHYLNQELSKAVKFSGAVLTHIMNEIEIACLPSHLPKFIDIDLSAIEAGQSLHVKDVQLPSGVTLVPYLEQENPVILSATIPVITSAESEASAESAGGEAAAAA